MTTTGPQLASSARLATCAMLALVAACSSQESVRTSDVAEAIDAAMDRGSDFQDVGGNTDLLVQPDVGVEVSSPPAAAFVRLELSGGEAVEGELVATYERWRWWSAQGNDTPLYAVFDPAGFAAYPADRSLRFVPGDDVVSIAGREGSSPTYAQFLRERGIGFHEPPLDDVCWVITGNESYHREENGYGDFAWDYVKTDSAGRRFAAAGAANEDYYVWDLPVRSSVAGTVVEVVSDGADNEPGSHPPAETAVNNFVGIALGGHYYAYYLHFRQGSIPASIMVGSTVEVGEFLGNVGNSGVTLEPHVHVTMLWWDATAGRYYSVPSEHFGVDVGPTPGGPFEPHDHVVPRSGDYVRESSR